MCCVLSRFSRAHWFFALTPFLFAHKTHFHSAGEGWKNDNNWGMFAYCASFRALLHFLFHFIYVFPSRLSPLFSEKEIQSPKEEEDSSLKGQTSKFHPPKPWNIFIQEEEKLSSGIKRQNRGKGSQEIIKIFPRPNLEDLWWWQWKSLTPSRWTIPRANTTLLWLEILIMDVCSFPFGLMYTFSFILG